MKKNTNFGRPALFNPYVVCFAAVLFTPIFGAALQARNWIELGDKNEAAASRFWVRSTIWLLIVFVVMQTLFRNEPVMNWMPPYFLAAMWLAWMATSGWKQLRFIRDNIGKNYEPRPIGKAITIGVAGWIFYGLIASTITLALVLAGVEPLDAVTGGQQAEAESAGVIVRVPEGSDKPVVEPLPPKADNAAP